MAGLLAIITEKLHLGAFLTFVCQYTPCPCGLTNHCGAHILKQGHAEWVILTTCGAELILCVEASS